MGAVSDGPNSLLQVGVSNLKVGSRSMLLFQCPVQELTGLRVPSACYPGIEDALVDSIFETLRSNSFIEFAAAEPIIPTNRNMRYAGALRKDNYSAAWQEFVSHAERSCSDSHSQFHRSFRVTRFFDATGSSI